MVDRILLLHRSWLELILSGRKIWELRGSRTHVRGRIGLAASGTGRVLGTANLVACLGPLSADELLENRGRHCVDEDRLAQIRYRNTFAWVVEDPVRLMRPIDYDHPRGAVIWVRCPPLHA